jgi:hypothetical protein
MSLYQITKNASHAVDELENSPRPVGGPFIPVRTLYSIQTSATSEFGELADEVRIDQGHSYKEAGVDGVVGEAIDTILCLLDLIHKYDPSITEGDLDLIAFVKCEKWINSVVNQKTFSPKF